MNENKNGKEKMNEESLKNEWVSEWTNEWVRESRKEWMNKKWNEWN